MQSNVEFSMKHNKMSEHQSEISFKIRTRLEFFSNLLLKKGMWNWQDIRIHVTQKERQVKWDPLYYFWEDHVTKDIQVSFSLKFFYERIHRRHDDLLHEKEAVKP